MAKETKPNKGALCVAMITTTPVGSGMEKLKCDDATGFTVPNTWWYLSAHPA